MGNDLYNEFVFVQNIPFRSLQQLMDNPQSIWFDDPLTAQKENRDDLIRKSLADALSDLETNNSPNPADWQWGRIHKVLFKHSFSGVSSIIDRLVNIGPYEIGGDGTTIFNTEYSFTTGDIMIPQFKHKEFENNLGPVMRYIYDFSAPDEINLILTTGESGNVMSNHYSDMTDYWLNGKYLKIKTDYNSIENKSNNLLILRAQ
jgi:penicillin amidase